MIGTLLYRLKVAWQLLTGKIKYIPDTRNKTLILKKDIDHKISESINQLDIEFVFTEFGEERINGGGSHLDPNNRLQPSLSGIKKYFPNARITVYTDFDWKETEGITIKKVISPVTDSEASEIWLQNSRLFQISGFISCKGRFYLRFRQRYVFCQRKHLLSGFPHSKIRILCCTECKTNF